MMYDRLFMYSRHLYLFDYFFTLSIDVFFNQFYSIHRYEC